MLLNGWPHYSANLNINEDAHGKYSLYNRFKEFEIMYHVAPWLPYSMDGQVIFNMSILLDLHLIKLLD